VHLCGSTAATIRSLLHPDVLVTSGGGGVGNATGLAELALVKTMAECKDMDVIALHSYDSSGSTSAEALDLQLAAYRCKPPNSTAYEAYENAEFTKTRSGQPAT
jgi:hypoxanthine phosphoribosyltransferase